MKNIDFLPKDEKEKEEAGGKKNKREDKGKINFSEPEEMEPTQAVSQNFLSSIKETGKKIAGIVFGAISGIKGGSGLKWEKSNIIGTNLIKEEVISFFNWRKKLYFFASLAGAAVLIVVISYTGLVIWEKSVQAKDEALISQIKHINEQITEAEGYVRDILKFQKKLKLAGDLLDKHIYWTNFFDFLEKNTLTDVYYAEFSGDTAGEYALAATAKSYSDITRQLKIFNNNSNVEEANTAGGTAGQTPEGGQGGASIGFQIGLKIKPEIFYK